MRIPERKTPVPELPIVCHHCVYDFEFCAGADELRRVIHHINFQGYILVGVTQDLSGIYTVFFRRIAGG